MSWAPPKISLSLFQRILITLVVTLLILSCTDNSDIKSEKVKSAVEIVSPKTAQAVINSEKSQFTRVSDLGAIAYALERYKLKHQMYPISSNKGKGWDGLYSDYGLSKVNWIEGLVPEFLSALPRDPRLLIHGSYQYIYKSNGANYKLIAHSPDDCEEVREVHPQLIDPQRDCWSYGYWTPRAVLW